MFKTGFTKRDTWCDFDSENGDDGILLYVMSVFSFINHLCCNLSLNGGSDRLQLLLVSVILFYKIKFMVNEQITCLVAI